MSSINSLLNHEPAQADGQTRPAHLISPTTTTTYDAADALATLATLGSGQQYVPSPTALSHPPRRSSTISSHAAPIEPEPPLELPQAHSPTLEQYHHASKSPEAQRRQSLFARSSPAPVLPPIQNRSASLQSQVEEAPAALGQDTSRVLSPLSQPADGYGRDETQNREPAFVRDEPTTSQCIAPESPTSTNPPLSQTSERPPIKKEPTGIPQEAPPAPSSELHHSITTESIDADTLKAIEIAKQSDLGLRVKRNASIAESIPSPSEQKPAPSKKRSAPSSAVKKKGTATSKKPPSKKRKLDTDGDAHARSVTPSSRPKTSSSKGGKKGSQAGTPVAESSPAPDHSSQIHPTDDEGESSEDNALYCICRKPDNHKWMIGCDGGCDDWFHGSCVNMEQADEDLVDRFICPLCEEKGRGTTTWKPMCRHNGCRKPARVTKGKESKYCSDECGTLFMSEQVQRTAGARAPKKRPKKKGGGKNGEEAAASGGDDDDEPTPLGGVLRAKDLKALIDQSKDIHTFKNLGSGVLSPPRTASPTKASFDPSLPNGSGTRPVDEHLALTAGETERLNALYREKSQLKERLEVLKDREKFVSLVKDQVTRVAEREKMKAKDVCGYDSRLSWSDVEFLRWRNSRVGRAAFRFMTLAPTGEQVEAMTTTTGGGEVGGDVEMDGDLVPPPPRREDSVCLKKRCQKHAQWQKQNLQDARFEEVEIAEAIRECEKQERSVRERAVRRGAKDLMTREVMRAEEGGGEAERSRGERERERNREGWVEVL